MMKICKECGVEKHLSEFYKHSQMADGYLNKCKECKRRYASEYSKTDAGRDTERRRNQKPKRKKILYERLKKWRRKNHCKVSQQNKKNSLKKKANGIVFRALKSGQLIKQCCYVCGEEKTEAHHEDYSKPLNVIWLCKKHHMIAHKRWAGKE